MPDSWDVYALQDQGNGHFSLRPTAKPLATCDRVSSADDPGNLVFSTHGDSRIVDGALSWHGAGQGIYEGSIRIDGVTGYVVWYPHLGPVLFVPTGVHLHQGGKGTLNKGAAWEACFTAGTLIRTPDGDRAVEDLRAGDLVLTANGVARPIRWLGRNAVARLFTDDQRLPVRIRAGALGENLPARDLVVSPGHAMLIADVLVQASALVNGTSIVRARNVPTTFTYYHVELDAHDVLLAEGTPTESFLLGAEDMAFDNWAERPAGMPAGPELAYPRVRAARQMPASIRRLIAQRATVVTPSAAADVA
jgi:Hint domain